MYEECPECGAETFDPDFGCCDTCGYDEEDEGA